MRWYPSTDEFKFKMKLNFAPKIRKHQVEQDINAIEIDERVPSMLTPRMVIGQVARIYDPLGFVLPVTLAGKKLIRELCSEQGDKLFWDRPMSEQSREKWISFFKELFGLEDLNFQRCLKPMNAIGKPMLIIFSDGSNIAYGACAYVRWELNDGKFESKLVLAKNRIAPARNLTIPKLELCGAILSARIRQKLVESMDYSFERIVHIVDSMIVRAQIQRESYGFGTFVATRVAEIQNKSDPLEWFWVSTGLNIADMTTRIHSPSDLRHDSAKWTRVLEITISSMAIRESLYNRLEQAS